jgi:hypothetical protein
MIFQDHFLPTFCVHLVHFSGFGIIYQEKSGNPAEGSAEFRQSFKFFLRKVLARSLRITEAIQNEWKEGFRRLALACQLLSLSAKFWQNFSRHSAETDTRGRFLTRVTSLGEFLPFGWLFPLGSVLKNQRNSVY